MSTNPKLILSVNGTKIKHLHEIKCLNIMIDDNLTWEMHINN